MLKEMFQLRRIMATLAFALSVGFVLSGIIFWRGVSAQNTNSTEQNQTRQRRTTEEQTQTTVRPSPTPSPSPQDDEYLQDDDVLRVETDLTNVFFTVVDKKRRFVTTLKQEDIRVLEDGKPQEIFTFQRQTGLPLSFAILVDTSFSMKRVLPMEKAAASAFIDSIMRPDKDEGAIVSFTGDSTLEQGLTGNKERVRRAIERVEFVAPSEYLSAGAPPIDPSSGRSTPPITNTPPIQTNTKAGSTAIWDAIWATVEEQLSRTSDRTRRAVILLTDGVDSSSQKKLNDAIERAVKSDVVVYSIGIYDEYFPDNGLDEGSLRKISERTGGRAFFPQDETELRAAFAQIESELRSQYLVAYSPTNKNRDGSFRRLQIEITNPDLRRQDLKLNYRQGYFSRQK